MKFSKILALGAAAVMAASMAGCGNAAKTETASDVKDYKTSVDGAAVVAEAGSAGEELVLEDDFFANANFTAVQSQATALMEVESGTADIAVIDYVMAGGSVGEGTDYADLEIIDNDFAAEEYGIAFRKDSDLTEAVNTAMQKLADEGKLEEIAKKYGVEDLILIKKSNNAPESYDIPAVTDLATSGKLVVGYTVINPLNYFEEGSQELTGFETDFAKAVAAELGLEVEFKEIDWDSKEIELNSKNIDCIWNGLTITPERQETMSITNPYLQNKQVMVAKKSK